MYVIGLTGGIASGKTTVTRRLAEHGAVVIDADLLAREVVQVGTPGLAAIAERFGPGVIAPDGSLDRPALGALIFSNEEARLALNAITHPAIRSRTKELLAAADAADPEAIVVHDVPLLAEVSASQGYEHFDTVVVVNASSETRLQRLIELRGMTRDEAERRISSQATDADRLAIADRVIDSNGTIEETLAQADRLWADVTHSRTPS